MAGVHSWESCLDGVALYVVYASGVEDVRNLNVDGLSALSPHLGLQRPDRTQVTGADVTGVAEVHGLTDHRAVNARSPSLFLFLFSNAGEQLEPELASHSAQITN